MGDEPNREAGAIDRAAARRERIGPCPSSQQLYPGTGCAQGYRLWNFL